jgi:hypothetical protein
MQPPFLFFLVCADRGRFYVQENVNGDFSDTGFETYSTNTRKMGQLVTTPTFRKLYPGPNSVSATTDRGVITIVDVKSEAVRDRDTILVGKTTYPMERKGSQSGSAQQQRPGRSRVGCPESFGSETDPAGLIMRRHSLRLTRVDAISSGICIHSAQPPLNCLEIKIFDGRISRSAAL